MEGGFLYIVALCKMFMKILKLIAFVVFANSATAQNRDTFHYANGTEIINGIKFSGFIDSKGFHLSKSPSKTTFNKKGKFIKFEFKDINGDGYKDIILYTCTDNEPEKYSVLVFVPKQNKFE